MDSRHSAAMAANGQTRVNSSAGIGRVPMGMAAGGTFDQRDATANTNAASNRQQR